MSVWEVFVSVHADGHKRLSRFAVSGWLTLAYWHSSSAPEREVLRSKSYVAYIYASETFINMQSIKTSHFEAKLERRRRTRRRQEVITDMC